MRIALTLAGIALFTAAPALAQSWSQQSPEPGANQAAAFDAARAQANYELLLRGQKRLDQLSPQEFAEVQALDQAARARSTRDKRSPRQKCLDEEIKRAGGNPSRLELGVIDLKCSQR